VVCLDQKLDVPELGAVEFDIAYGGAFYAFVDATAVGLDLNRCDLAELSIRGMAIKRAIARQLTLTHPTSPDLAFLYGTIFTGPAQADHAFSRHACVFAEGAVDRSPTGTGVAARLAIMVARGQSRLSEHHHFESLTGVCFRGRAVRQVDHHGVRAIIPEIAGSAAFTGQHTFLLEPDDPLPQGFWARPMP
jgi:trans-L-3-hydroxyproline dehydratase